MIDLLFLIGGLIVLVLGGEFLVRGAVGIAQLLRLSPLIIGLTVVSFGTSAPELLVSINAAINDNAGIAIGNVVGSNIANIALVLGVTVLIFPIAVDRQTKIIDWPVMMAFSLLFYLFALDGLLELYEGVVLFCALILYTAFLIRKSRKDNAALDEAVEVPNEKASSLNSTGFLLLGLIGLYFGSEWMLQGAIGIAESLGMSQRVIGLTIVAFGTSAPELVASCVAAFRKQTDISVGNLIGSNIFNIGAVLGITSTVTDIEVESSVLNFDIFWMLGIALIILPMMLIGKKLDRFKGILLFSTYIVYIFILVSTI